MRHLVYYLSPRMGATPWTILYDAQDAYISARSPSQQIRKTYWPRRRLCHMSHEPRATRESRKGNGHAPHVFDFCILFYSFRCMLTAGQCSRAVYARCQHANICAYMRPSMRVCVCG